jgi:aryl-alcohol dehydrogenase-like predicted oxidoreductase
VNVAGAALGDTRIGRLGLGCARWGADDVTALVEAAVELGITFVDTADVYGSVHGRGRAEELLGAALKRSPRLRDELVIGTKGGIVPRVAYDSSPEYLVAACEGSLRRLGVDAVHLFSVHRPDLFAHPEEVASALRRLLDDGKARYVGLSNHSPAQIAALAPLLGDRLVATSPELSLLARGALRDGVLDQAAALGLTVLAWGPLAVGALATGNAVPAPLVEALDRLAAREDVSRATIAIAFLLALPGVVPLLGTTNERRLRELARATTVRLERADLYALLQAAEGEPLP